MYKDSSFSAIDKSAPVKILIVKTSSLGDIIQSFPILSYLHKKFPASSIDWAVEESLAPAAAAHPLIRKTIALDIKGLKKGWRSLSHWKKVLQSIKELKRERYDLIFDLQGNCKSGMITALARAKIKIGFGLRSVREWPNVLATNVRFEIPKQTNIRLQHIGLAKQFFQDSSSAEVEGVRFRINHQEKRQIDALLARPELSRAFKVMVCPGSKWSNKQLPVETMSLFLKAIDEKLSASFILIWGGEEEKAYCEKIRRCFPDHSHLADRLSLPAWQNLMGEVNLVIAVDSSALHLCGTTSTPSFSLFGPTNPEIFKPIGSRHFAIRGSCPYGRSFNKTCPVLRSCSTGACIRELTANEIARSFTAWWNRIEK